ncbi:MAG: hypothetical protein P9X24_03240, partial [Candidatus Hatepunaea meridiana]|nr:hypothetical protein [Candidatus Hatepunaea meridiana]
MMIRTPGNKARFNTVLTALLLSFILQYGVSWAESSIRVLLVKPEATLRYLDPLNSQTQMDSWIQVWSDLVSTSKFEVEIMNESALCQVLTPDTTLRLINRYNLVILPGVLCMDDSDIDALVNYLENGG